MAIEGDLQAVLAPLAGGRCYPIVAPDNTPTPYINYQVISRIPEVDLDGPLETENRRVQIDCYDRSYSGAKNLETQLRSSMELAAFVNIPLVSRESYEEDTKLYRVSLDYSIWT